MQDEPEHDHHFEGFTLEEIKKNFKALASELVGEGVPLSELMKKVDEPEVEEIEVHEPKIPYFRGYDPDINDFLARAKTHEECVEIIEYCLSKGEITQKEAEKFYERLERGGPRAFGTREPGYYDRML